MSRIFYKILRRYFSLVLLMLLYSIFKIRYQHIYAGRIGHEIGETEILLAELASGLHGRSPKENYVWLTSFNRFSNEFLLSMLRRRLTILDTDEPEYLVRAISFLTRTRGLVSSEPNAYDVHDVLSRFPPSLSFLPDDHLKAEEGLGRVGVVKGHRWICLLVRDFEYFRKRKHLHSTMSYSDYRNSQIQNFREACLQLANLGYFVFRMGADAEEELGVEHERIIDYANSTWRTPFMDVYLAAHCFFMITTGSGLDSVAQAFRRPRVFVSLAPYQAVPIQEERCLAIFKHYIDADTGRSMIQREINSRIDARHVTSRTLTQAGILLQENSSQEITSVVLEQEARLTNKFSSSAGDIDRQKRFWSGFIRVPEWHGTTAIRARIGSDFLKNSTSWIQDV